jgi:hypothetical protein
MVQLKLYTCLLTIRSLPAVQIAAGSVIMKMLFCMNLHWPCTIQMPTCAPFARPTSWFSSATILLLRL